MTPYHLVNYYIGPALNVSDTQNKVVGGSYSGGTYEKYLSNRDRRQYSLDSDVDFMRHRYRRHALDYF
jgi:hypothetical protein